jgi:hypothetical protein
MSLKTTPYTSSIVSTVAVCNKKRIMTGRSAIFAESSWFNIVSRMSSCAKDLVRDKGALADFARQSSNVPDLQGEG